MVQTKSKNVSQNEALELIYDFYKMFEDNFNQGTVPNLSEWGTFLNKNFTLTSNGAVKCKSLDEYLRRYKLFQEYYDKFKFSQPIIEPLISGNQAVIYYNIDLKTHEGTKVQVYIMAICTIENGKIAKWTQVAHEKGSSDWDE